MRRGDRRSPGWHPSRCGRRPRDTSITWRHLRIRCRARSPLPPGAARTAMRDEPRVEPLGDRAVVVHCGEAIDEETFRRVQAVRARIQGNTPAGTTDVVAGFTSVALHFDPLLVRRSDGVLPIAAMTATVAALVAHLDAVPVVPGRTFEIPVCYEGEMAPDLGEVAWRAGLGADEVIAIHSAAEYVVRVVGFLPGFPYLGGLDPRLVTPRRDTPRKRVPAGSVGIGGAQTGIYPLE